MSSCCPGRLLSPVQDQQGGQHHGHHRHTLCHVNPLPDAHPGLRLHRRSAQSAVFLVRLDTAATCRLLRTQGRAQCCETAALDYPDQDIGLLFWINSNTSYRSLYSSRNVHAVNKNETQTMCVVVCTQI